MSNVDESTEFGHSLQTHLALGLHAFAQPLAILRAKLYLESISKMDSGELQQLALDSAGQVERLCTLFNYLQEIVLAETTEPHLTAFSLNEVLEKVVDGVDLWFRDTGLTLTVPVSSSARMVFADRTRLSQAVTSLALLAHSLSKPGDAVVVSTFEHGDGTGIVVSNTDSQIKSLNAETRLALALAETNIRKQHGSLTSSLQPLELIVHVPDAPIAR